MRDRCHFNLAIVAVANKLARLVWAVWTRDTARRRVTAPATTTAEGSNE